MDESPRRRIPRAVSSKRELLRADLRRSTPEQVADAVHTLLDQSSVSSDDRVQLLAGALVVEALKPFWTSGRTPQQAHDALCMEDPELASAIEALAPMLLGRAESRETAREAIASVESLLGLE